MNIPHFFIFAVLSTYASLAAEASVKFIEMKRYELEENLPPRLIAVFELSCNQKFLQIIRREDEDPISRLTTISVGGLVSEKAESCDNTALREIKIPAGYTYSGRAHEVRSIKAN